MVAEPRLPEDVKAIVEDAYRLGMKVAVHVVDKAKIEVVMGAGVDSVEHAFQATDAQLHPQQLSWKVVGYSEVEAPSGNLN